MNLPKSVQAQLERAAELQNQNSQPPQPQSQPPVDDSAQAPETPQQPQTPAPDQAPPAEDWQQKYRTLQGMYNRQQGEMAARNEQFEQQIRELRQQLEQRNAQPTPPAPAPSLVTEADRKAFGDDLIDVVRRVTQEQLAPIVAKLGNLEPQLQTTVQTVEQTQQRSRQQAVADFKQRLAERVDDWEVINYDPEFLAWLEQSTEETGLPRREHFSQAVQALDAVRVARYFKRFKDERKTPPAPPKPPLTPQPPRSQGGVTPSSQEQPEYVRASEIREFYRQAAIGRYRDKPQEYARLDAHYSRAAAEGRVLD